MQPISFLHLFCHSQLERIWLKPLSQKPACHHSNPTHP